MIVSTPTASLISKSQIEISGNYELAMTGFFRFLPNSRFNKKTKMWRCDATPAAAADIINAGINVDDGGDVKKMAALWSESQRLRERYMPREMEDFPNPPWFKLPPWKHQRKSFWLASHWLAGNWSNASDEYINDRSTLRGGAYLGKDMGTGKSMVAVLLAANLQCKKVLVLCPKSVIGVWPREFRKHCPVPWAATLLEKGTSKKKAKQIANDSEKLANGHYFEGPHEFCDGDTPMHVVVVNYESAWRADIAKELMNHDWCIIIADEAHRIKSATGKASTFCGKLATKATYRVGLSGTPTPHEPVTDSLGIYRFLDAGIFGTSITRHRSKYCLMNPVFKSKVDGYQNESEFEKKFHSIFYRVRADDVLDLPKAMYEQRTFELGAKAAKIYKGVRDEMLAMIEGNEITVANALVKIIRLQQITSGFIVDDDGVEHNVDDGKEKLLADLLEDVESSEPVVVFCRFTNDLAAVRRTAEKLGRTYGEISGQQRDLTADATMPPNIQVMGVQEQSGGLGIDLTRSRFSLWYSLSHSLSDYDQANRRINRPGQTRPTMTMSLVAENTIDPLIYQALAARRKVVESVIEGLRLF